MNFCTERLEIRTISAADLELYCQIYCDPVSMQFVAPAYDRAKARRCFAYALRESQKSEQNLCLMSVAWRICGTKIGICGYQRMVHDANIFEPGFMLLPGAQSQGVATEFLAALCPALFCQTTATEIWLQYRADNVALARLANRLGFTLQEQLHANMRLDTLNCDALNFRAVLRR